jgi:hypothetical protein
MFLDDIAEQINGFFYVRVIEFLQLLNEHVQHRNSHFSLFSIMSVDVLDVAFLSFFFFRVVVDMIYLLFYHILDKNEETWKDILKVGSKLSSIN